MKPLPQGFILDNQSQLPAPPAGFVLDYESDIEPSKLPEIPTPETFETPMLRPPAGYLSDVREAYGLKPGEAIDVHELRHGRRQPTQYEKPLDVLGTKQIKRTGAGAAGAFMRGTSAFMDALDSMSDKVAELTGLPKGGIFEAAAEQYKKNSEYWDKKAEGATLPEKIVSEFLGGAAPGMAEFMLGPGYAAAVGYAETGTAGGAAKAGTKRYIMGKILHASNILKRAPRTAAMATVGGIEAAAQGGGPEEIATGAGVMAGFGIFGGGEGKSIREAIKPPKGFEIDHRSLKAYDEMIGEQRQARENREDIAKMEAELEAERKAIEKESKNEPYLKTKPFEIPEELKPAFEIMKEQVYQGEIQKSDQGYVIGSTYPDWFTQAQPKFSEKEFDDLINKAESGRAMSVKQSERFDELINAAEELNRTHPDLITEAPEEPRAEAEYTDEVPFMATLKGAVYQDQEGKIYAVDKAPYGNYTIYKKPNLKRKGQRVRFKKMDRFYPSHAEAQEALDQYAKEQGFIKPDLYELVHGKKAAAPAKEFGPLFKQAQIPAEFKTRYNVMEDEKGVKGLLANLDPMTPEYKKAYELYKQQGQEVLDQYREKHPTGPILLFRHRPEVPEEAASRDQGVMIHKSTKDPGRWQMTYWDRRGFSGDHSEATEVEAVQEAFMEGYRRDGFDTFKQIEKTDRFLKGVLESERIQKEHRERMKAGAKKPEAMATPKRKSLSQGAITEESKEFHIGWQNGEKAAKIAITKGYKGKEVEEKAWYLVDLPKYIEKSTDDEIHSVYGMGFSKGVESVLKAEPEAMATPAPEYVQNPAVRLPDGRIIEGDYSRGGHIEIASKLSSQEAKTAIDGAVTSKGRFVEKRPDIDFSEIKGREVSEVSDMLVQPGQPPWKARGRDRSPMKPTEQDIEYIIEENKRGKERSKKPGQHLFLTGGPPGAGKSTSLKELGLKKNEFVIANSDEIKKQAGYGVGKDADLFHEASSSINKRLVRESLNEGYDLIYDSLMSNYALAKDLIQQVLKKEGKVTIAFTNIDAETSQARSIMRTLLYNPEKGKFLSEREIPIGASVKGYNNSLPTFLQLFKEYENDPHVDIIMIDNNVDLATPKVIFKKIEGKMEIVDKDLFDKLTKTPYHKTVKEGKARYERDNPLEASELKERLPELYQRARQAAEKVAQREGFRTFEKDNRQFRKSRRKTPDTGRLTPPQKIAAEAMAAPTEPVPSPAPQVPATISGATFNPIEPGLKRSDILKRVSDRLNIPIRTGKIGVKAGPGMEVRGIYKQRERVIRLKTANDVEVAAHEIGHDIQDVLRMENPPEEIKALATPGKPAREGFAEFVRLYVVDNAKAKAKSPAFYKDFEKALEEHPDIKDVIYKAREAMEIWNASTPTQRMASFIKYGHEVKQHKMPTLNEIYRGAVDDLRPYQEAIKLMEQRTGKETKPSENFYMLARLLKGWPRKAYTYLRDGTFQIGPEGWKRTGPSLKEILRPIEKKGDLLLLDTYLFAKQALTDERVSNAFVGRKIVKVGDPAAVVAELEPRFRSTAKQLYKYSDELLTYLTDAGRVSQELADRIRQKNLFYAPLYRVMQTEPPGSLGTRKIDNVFNPIKRRGESTRDIYSPVENIVKNTYMYINSAERNRIGEALLKMADKEGMGDLIEATYFNKMPLKVRTMDALNQLARFLKTVPSDRAVDMQVMIDQIIGHQKDVLEIIKLSQDPKWMEENGLEGIENAMEKARIKPEDMFLLQKFVLSFKPNIKAGPNEAIFFKRGEPVLVELDPVLARAVKAMDAEQTNIAFKLLAMPAKWLRAGATTLSPEFIARNPIRDQWSALVYSKYGFVPGYDLARGIFHIAKRDALYQQYNASGAAHAALVSLDRDYLSKNLKEIMKGVSPKDIVKSPLQALQVLSEFMEEGTRVGEFARGLKKEGADLEGLLKAGLAARDVTLDFQRIGAYTKGFNAITAFFNAQLQGTDKMVRELFTEKGTRGKTLAKALIGITAPSIALWLAQHDDPNYQELPTWRKILFWNIVTYPDGRDKKPRIWSIPKPFELGVIFGSVPEMVLNWIEDEDPEAIKELSKSVATGFLPGAVPTAALPVFEWIANKNFFFDRPLEPRGTEEASPWMRYGERTPESLKLLTEGMSYVPGVRELASPEKIRNMIQAYTGGFGRLTLESVDTILKEFKIVDVPPAPSMELADLPGLRGFITRYPTANTHSIEQFYHRYEKGKRKYADQRIEMGLDRIGLKLPKGASQVLKFGAGGAQLISDEITARQLTNLRLQARQVWRARKMTGDQKRQALENIYWSMINTARSALGKKQLTFKESEE